jgi:glycosyltransferase involved in cell wall biosynthesis
MGTGNSATLNRTRVLSIARYHRPDMERKLALIAAGGQFAMRLVRPASWRDQYGRVDLPVAISEEYSTLPREMLGRPDDPHRALYRSISFALREVRPDIIHAEEEPDSLAALQIAVARRVFAPSARLIYHTWQNINRPKRWPVRRVLAVTLKCADAVLCANSEAVRVLRAMGYVGPADVIPQQGVDLRVFHPSEPRRQDGTFTIIYAGRLVPEKGLDTLVEAVRRLIPRARLVVVGDGPSRRALEDQVSAANLDDLAQFIDSVRPEQLRNLFASSDALALPSRTTSVWKEQFGRVLVEAMACQVPVVGSDSGAIPEVIGDAGLIFPEGDAGALADCLQRLIESPGLRRELAERGYNRVRWRYSQERVAELTAQFYQSMMVSPVRVDSGAIRER